MTNYSENEKSVRVDFFKESGKWYTTEAVIWTGKFKNHDIHLSFSESLFDHLFKEPIKGVISVPRLRMQGRKAICLQPYHEHSHPICIDVDDILVQAIDGRLGEERKRKASIVVKVSSS